MTPLLLVLLGLSDWAVFYSGTHTYLVDADRARLYAAPGWYAADDLGNTWRYRVGVDNHRHPNGLEGEIWPASRWTVLEQARVGGAANESQFKALTPIPATPPPGDGHLQDEVAVLQFTGSMASIQQTARRYGAEGTTTTTELYTLQLPSGAREPGVQGGSEAVEWLDRRLPGLLDRCLRRPVGVVTQEMAGGAEVRRLALGAQSDRCAGELRVLDLGEVMDTGGGMQWWQSVAPKAGPEARPVLDARPNAGQDHALLLLGAQAADEDADALRPPACAQRFVSLWTPQGQAPLGAALSLDGARWLAPSDPLIDLVRTRFLPAKAGICTTPFELDAGDPRAPEPSAHLCKIDEEDRAWGGPDDLAGSVAGSIRGGRLILDVRVVDPGRDAEDGVHVWLGGDRRRAVHFKVRQGGIGVWGNRKTRQRIKGLVDFSHKVTRDGYSMRIEVPASLAGAQPAIAVQIEDRDPGVEGKLSFWVGGNRVTAYKRRPTVCELPR